MTREDAQLAPGEWRLSSFYGRRSYTVPTPAHLFYYLVSHPELVSHALTFLAVTNSSFYLPSSPTASSPLNFQKSVSVQTHVTLRRDGTGLSVALSPWPCLPSTQAVGLNKGSAVLCIFKSLGNKTGMW